MSAYNPEVAERGPKVEDKDPITLKKILLALLNGGGGGDGGGGDVNLTEIGGSAIATNSGGSGAGVQRVILVDDQIIPVKIDQTTSGTTNLVAVIPGVNGVSGNTGAVTAGTQRVVLATNVGLPAGESHIGQTGGTTAIVPVTFSLDTLIYAASDLLADTQTVAGAFRINDGTGVLQTITLNDKDAQGVAMSIVLMSTATSLGTENSAPSISDANLDGCLGIIAVAAADWVTVNGAKIATIRGIGLPVKAISGAATLGIALINGSGTPTFTASGITARLGIFQD